MNKLRLEKYRFLFILIAALLTIVVLMVFARLPLYVKENYNNVFLTEENGYYDISKISDLNDKSIKLLPSGVYYPNVYLNPENINKVIPESISNYKKINSNYISQHFVLKVSADDIYRLKFTLSKRHAMRVYVNGEIVGQTGKLGKTKKDTEVWENNISFEASPINGKIDIILNSAQFYHAKSGASIATLNLEKAYTNGHNVFSKEMKGILLSGMFFGAAIILLGMYVLLFRTKSTLYFSLACLSMIIREILQSEAWTYFPISGNLSFMLEYISLVLITIFLTLYLSQFTKNKFLMVIKYISLISSLIYGVFVLFFDSLFYTSVLVYYQIILFICIFTGVSGLFWIMRKPTKEQSAILYGIAVFYFAAISDIIMYNDLFGDSVNVPISELAMGIFVLAQTVSLFFINNRIIAETKEMEQVLAIENENLEKLSRMKTEFLGNISHELKTPLTVMSGYAQTTRISSEKDEVLDKVEIAYKMKLISSEAERLSLMVGQILDITRVEEGRMVITREKCRLEEIIHSSIETHYPILNKNDNRLEIKLNQTLPYVFADSVRISQVIINLISNATRFTSNGLIIVSSYEENEEKDFVVVCVSDTGEGIEEERLPYIFGRYNNEYKTLGKKSTGTGLGLFICKNIIEQHGGKIWVESKKGNGTSVYFTVPIFKENVQ